jgi:hypothetical protein
MEASGRAAELLQIHKIISQELRHTATVIWQFSIAIVTLQGGAVGLSAHLAAGRFESALILATGFFLALCFSLMLIRQAIERKCFAERIRAVEAELDRGYPQFFAPIDSDAKFFRFGGSKSTRLSRFFGFGWFKSTGLGWVLLIESGIGFLFFSFETGLQVKDRPTRIHAAGEYVGVRDSQGSTQPSSPTPESSPAPTETPIPKAIPVASPTRTPSPSPHPRQVPHRSHSRRHR